MKSQPTMLVSWLIAMLLIPVGTIQAVEDNPETGSAEAAFSLIVGRVAKVDGQHVLVEEEGGGSVQVQITPDTRGAKTLAIGEQVMISLLPSGVASVITSGAPSGDTEPLHVGEVGAR